MKLNHLLSLLVVCCLFLSGTIFSLLLFQNYQQEDEKKRLDFIMSVQSSMDVLRSHFEELELKNDKQAWLQTLKASLDLRNVVKNMDGDLFSQTPIANLLNKQLRIHELLKFNQQNKHVPAFRYLIQEETFVRFNQILFEMSEDVLALHYGLLAHVKSIQQPLALMVGWILVMISFGVSILTLLFHRRFQVGLQGIKEAIREVKPDNLQGLVETKYDDELRIIADELSLMKNTLNDTMVSRDALKLEVEKQTGQLRAQHDELKQLANTDSLTGLLNRRAFDMQVKTSIARAKRVGGNAVLLYMDVNDFKYVNDEYGHEVGDFVLTEIASRLTCCVRETDLVARIGGDEFIIWLDLIASDLNAEVAIFRVFKCMDKSIYRDDLKMNINLSIGAAIFPIHSDNLNVLMKIADQEMYKAKVIKNSQNMQVSIHDDNE